MEIRWWTVRSPVKNCEIFPFWQRIRYLKRIANDNIQFVMIEFSQEDHVIHEWDLIYRIPLQVIFSLSRDGWNESYGRYLLITMLNFVILMQTLSEFLNINY